MCCVALALTAFGCESDKPKGGLAVVLESDLSMPKDIDRVIFDVSIEGESIRHEEFMLGQDGLLMPAELRVSPVSGNSPVLIRVLGYKEGQARIERSAITQIPGTFVAMLRMPLNYLCTGTARVDGTSTCGDGQTCKQGACSDANVVSEELPMYQSGPWSGAETGTRDPQLHDCFNVFNCFSAAERVTVDRASCSFTLDQDDPGYVSVGIKLPQGSDGICGAGSCWVAIDEGPEGWTRNGPIFTLPPSLCADRPDGSRLTIVASNMCGAKVVNTPPCGEWSSAAHPADTSETVGRIVDPTLETPGDPVGLSCAGLSYQPCGFCGQQKRTCRNGTWTDWGQCLGQGECAANTSESCGENGNRVCSNTCEWGECSGQTCVGMAVEACGNCGTRRRKCVNGAWSEWGACENQGVCEAGTTQACGVSGTQACMGDCSWGACGDDGCLGAPSQACGNCGTQTRVCDPATRTWSDFGPCSDEGACEANQTQVCGLSGMQTCGGNCEWDAACTGQVCEGPASQQCGACGIQTRVCNNDTGVWSDWSVCTGEGVCLTGTTMTCGAGGTRACLTTCQWSDECTGQLCEGPMTETCGNCGTRSHECNGSTGEWFAWGFCFNAGPCNPAATRRCGTGGTQTCTPDCTWSNECLGQSCGNEPLDRPCPNGCGVQTRSCNGSTGEFSDWSACTITQRIDNDGCCPPGAGPGNDNDCVGCGNGKVEQSLGETCDGLCPDRCDDGNACTMDSLRGEPNLCNVTCSNTRISACISGDGCCPSTCNFDSDKDCDNPCGNMRLDEGEICDNTSNTRCPDCNDNDDCTRDGSTGSANTCDLVCTHTPINSPQCLCGNRRLDEDETCDNTSNTQCPDCDDNDVCTRDGSTGSADTCDLVCTHTPINSPECLCGNGTRDPDETCDDTSNTECPTSCTKPNACTAVTLTGSPKTCDAACSPSPITACDSGDGCCPDECSFETDKDCEAPPQPCGNERLDPNETCDNSSNTRCPSTCDDGDPCTEDGSSGSADTCNFRCTHAPINSAACLCGNGDIDDGERCDPQSDMNACPTSCAQPDLACVSVQLVAAGTCNARCERTTISACLDSSDGCCPGSCNANNDSDCQPRCGNGVVEAPEQCDEVSETCENCRTVTPRQPPPPDDDDNSGNNGGGASGNGGANGDGGPPPG